ncbi:efflux RND transporter permease subunit [Myxosarcina sp. GI1]|uniref:efflux RND transporter permease subunit n=1 Tax=Myxosarcina sp. GI1 TaxID=1541065 RepID=UPI0006918A08|nr:efflux RND transporter permease subunit [Myxosarcina sp. GI1]
MFSSFFIKRPVFTSVCALLILLLGAVSIPTLPIAQYPQIAPPQVSVTANYIGASANVVENTVTNILEREINGVEGSQYISSTSSSGSSSIEITFDPSRDADLAAVDVQNRVSVAEARLPETVQRTGVVVERENAGFLMAIGLFSEGDRYSPIFLSNYADISIAEALQRVNGVGNVQIFGERRYAMRLWLNPNQLASRNLTPQDVVDAISEQNIQAAIGGLGQQPASNDLLYQIELEANTRLRSVEEFENVVVSSEDDDALIQVKDVGRVELGAQDYSTFLRFNGQEAIGLGITQLPGSNALDVAKAVKAELARLSEDFPPGIQYQVAFDATEFVDESLSEVVFTLIQAVLLVILIIFIFLQDWRTTIIPVLTIPTSLIGTFIFVRAFGFSLNTLTLFGLTLATGIVVDDAIIVVENISRLIEEGESPGKAAIASMQELSSAVIATSLVLMAVFIPVAFFPGATGAIYRQFALTLAFSIAVSTFLALTLAPSASALLLRRGNRPPRWLNWFFSRFNRFLDWVRRKYRRLLEKIVHFKSIVIGLFIVLLGFTAFLYTQVPGGFLPEEDQGYFITIVQGPPGVSLDYTRKVMQQAESEMLELPEVQAVFTVGGFSFGGGGANSGIMFTNLQPWSQRTNANQSAQALIGSLRQQFAAIPEARILPNNPPAIRGLGSFGGFTLHLQELTSSEDIDNLVEVSNQFLQQANQRSQLESVYTTFTADTPRYQVTINRDAAKALQVDIDDILATLGISLGSQYVNDFTLQQRNYRVYVQADKEFRAKPDDVRQLYVRSANDEMVSLANLVTLTPTSGPSTIPHFNLFRSIEISGSAAEGYSSGEAISTIGDVAEATLPAGYDYAWSGTALEEISSGGQAPIIFGLGLVMVFLVLAAQYENYFDPLIIMMAVPLAVMGALLALSLRGLENDVYGQIGLVMLIGLASKNSILIVEFANQLREQGYSTVRAAVEAAEQRLRPILMTAFSTIVGLFPLAIASGAGAASRQSLGTVVIGGMIVATFLSLLVVPVLYIVISGLSDRISKHLPSPPTDAETGNGRRDVALSSSGNTKTDSWQ